MFSSAHFWLSFSLDNHTILAYNTKLVNMVTYLSLFCIQRSYITFYSHGSESYFHLSGLDKLRMCICEVLQIINFTDCCSWLFSNKYVHEHNFSLFWVCEII